MVLWCAVGCNRSPVEQLLVGMLFFISFGLDKPIIRTWVLDFWSKVFVGKTSCLAVDLGFASLRYCGGFLKVEACTKISHRIILGLGYALMMCFWCRNSALWLLTNISQLEDMMLGMAWSWGWKAVTRMVLSWLSSSFSIGSLRSRRLFLFLLLAFMKASPTS